MSQDQLRPVTVNELEVLLHFHTSGALHPHQEAPAVLDAIMRWIRVGMLRPCDNDDADERKMIHSHYETTDKAKHWIDHLLSTPLPELVWKIPEHYEFKG